MIAKLKNILYFPIASYFRFFAQMRLNRWKPRVIVVTGSNGKTTLFQLLKSQLGSHAKYSDHANSSFGIPFDILNLHRTTLLKTEWISLFIFAPINAFKPAPKTDIYIVEADCDRPGEGKFLASMLRPEVVLWLNTARTHGMNFEGLVKENKHLSVEELIAYEFGYFIEYCQKLAIINGDQELIDKQKNRSHVEIVSIKKSIHLESYQISRNDTIFGIHGVAYSFAALLPIDVFYSIVMSEKVTAYLGLPFDSLFSSLVLPPGRSSLFKGIKDISIVDSCYNANLASMKVILEMFNTIPGQHKWAVLGDMLEQGDAEREQHEKLAEIIINMKLERIILMGPRISKYTYPELKRQMDEKVILEKFLYPKEVLDYLLENISGNETILFKGARFLEGVIENLLANKEDVKKLSRREKVWEIRRKQWGL